MHVLDAWPILNILLWITVNKGREGGGGREACFSCLSCDTIDHSSSSIEPSAFPSGRGGAGDGWFVWIEAVGSTKYACNASASTFNDSCTCIYLIRLAKASALLLIMTSISEQFMRAQPAVVHES